MLKDFKEFALKGNVVDLAVAVVIGGAFGKIVTSFVSDIIMPIIAVLTSGISFTDLAYVNGNVTITYGNFIQSIVDFLIIAFFIFLAIRLISKARKKEEAEEAPAAPSAPTETELLTEIRDLLKAKGENA
ncbi:MAG: large conductance mechanosensitive channel protein MscL [Eubacteriales bacterium]|nr:large conductance mechanosensitive channel protein MscL [Eubacteriales bacterium]MDD4565017.1 large conductance mechanosensitive channel protein MscL [Eubacteriales bacterium]